jgi:hypothetical protein
MIYICNYIRAIRAYLMDGIAACSPVRARCTLDGYIREQIEYLIRNFNQLAGCLSVQSVPVRLPSNVSAVLFVL